MGIAGEVYDTQCEVFIKGQIYHNDTLLPRSFPGKKIYLDNNNITTTYPGNLTTTATGNIFIGTVLSQNRILVGL